MNTSLNHGSAKIYQFPVGGRSALASRGQNETKTAADLGSSRLADVASASSWYHQAAIEEAKPVRDH
jgi:Protein of unknown function (DUF2735)